VKKKNEHQNIEIDNAIKILSKKLINCILAGKEWWDISILITRFVSQNPSS